MADAACVGADTGSVGHVPFPRRNSCRVPSGTPVFSTAGTRRSHITRANYLEAVLYFSKTFHIPEPVVSSLVMSTVRVFFEKRPKNVNLKR